MSNFLLRWRRKGESIFKISNLEFSKNLSLEFEMGCDMVNIEPSKIENYARKPCTWKVFYEGSLVPFMEVMEGYDDNVSS